VKSSLNKQHDKRYFRMIPWKLLTYSCINVYRNKWWWKENFYVIKDFWSDVLFYKEFGYESLVKKPRPSRKDQFMFISDPDIQLNRDGTLYVDANPKPTMVRPKWKPSHKSNHNTSDGFMFIPDSDFLPHSQKQQSSSSNWDQSIWDKCGTCNTLLVDGFCNCDGNGNYISEFSIGISIKHQKSLSHKEIEKRRAKNKYKKRKRMKKIKLGISKKKRKLIDLTDQ